MMTRDDSAPPAHPPDTAAIPGGAAAEGGDGPSSEREALLRLLAEGDSRRVRDAREHASQLLALQQRASNDRDTLSVLHARQIADLKQAFDAALADIHRRFDALLGEARADAARARERASAAEARAAQLHIEQSATAARLEAERVRAERAASLLAEEQDRARLHPLQMDALRQAAARDQERATSALGARAESAAALLVERERRAQAEDLLLRLADELDRVQVRPAQELAGRVERLLEQLAVAGQPAPRDARRSGGGPGTVPRNADELLQLADEPFVCAAYRVVLGRETDPEGLAEHLRRVRQGVPRMDIVAALAHSPEAQQRGGAPAWVTDALAAAAPARRSAPRRLFSRIAQALLRPVVTQLHRIENTLLRLEAAATAQADGLAASVDATRAAVLTQLHTSVGEVLRRQAQLPAEVAVAALERLGGEHEAGERTPAEAGTASVAMQRARAVLSRSGRDAP